MTPQIILNRFVKIGFRSSKNYILTDNSDIANDKWNYVATYSNLNDRHFTHYMEIDNNVHMCGTWTDNEILS